MPTLLFLRTALFFLSLCACLATFAGNTDAKDIAKALKIGSGDVEELPASAAALIRSKTKKHGGTAPTGGYIFRPLKNLPDGWKS